MSEPERAVFAPPGAVSFEYAPFTASLSTSAASAAPAAHEPHSRPAAEAFAEDILAAVVFGRSRPSPADPRLIHVPLDVIGPPGPIELWRGNGPVRRGQDGNVRFAADEEHLAGILELDEREHGSLARAAEWAYATIRRFQSRSAHPHLLRMWNYFDAINRGAGDEERYKQFCIGRAAGFEPAHSSPYPAATAIGRRDGSSVLQVYWLAGRTPGTPLENPRQVSAYRYPRRYGPAPPSFSRAMLLSSRVLISGTASILGHASRHPGSLLDQLDETLANLASLLDRAAAAQPTLPRRFGAHTLLKVYLRDQASAASAAAYLAERLPAGVRCLMLEADICRPELLVEIDCVHA